MKYFLIFSYYSSHGDFAFESSLVLAENEDSAIQKYCEHTRNSGTAITPADFEAEEGYPSFGIHEMNPIT